MSIREGFPPLERHPVDDFLDPILCTGQPVFSTEEQEVAP